MNKNQNVEVVNFAGILEENIITQVSEDANNLRIQVKDLQYPGAGVEFSVDIVNVGTRFTPTRKIDTLITALTTTEAWAELSASVPGAIAQGSPTLEDFLESMNALPDERPSNEKMETILKAHLPYKTELQNNYNLLGYWLATPVSGDAAEYAAYAILYNSTGYYCYWNSGACGIRPVITLPSDLVGTLGDTVTIQK